MPRISAARKTFDGLARKRARGYPIATVAYYAPDDKYRALITPRAKAVRSVLSGKVGTDGPASTFTEGHRLQAWRQSHLVEAHTRRAVCLSGSSG